MSMRPVTLNTAVDPTFLSLSSKGALPFFNAERMILAARLPAQTRESPRVEPSGGKLI